ncbi:hypothetical protein AEGHOMDF_4483 [Methylobacterium soli]|nr:hypothetical protein AEGHOMDF_4483 [Methylobacterium soli]
MQSWGSVMTTETLLIFTAGSLSCSFGFVLAALMSKKRSARP